MGNFPETYNDPEFLSGYLGLKGLMCRRHVMWYGCYQTRKEYNINNKERTTPPYSFITWKVGGEQRGFFAGLRAWALNQRNIYFSDSVEFTKNGNTLFRPVYGRLTLSSSFMSVQTKIRSWLTTTFKGVFNNSSFWSLWTKGQHVSKTARFKQQKKRMGAFPRRVTRCG